MRAFLPASFRGLPGVLAVLLCGSAASAQSFTNPPLYATTVDVGGLAAADVNHDGKIDLVYLDATGSAPTTLHVALGKGDGTFTHGQDMPLPPGICCSLTLADVTNDGKLDVLLSGVVPAPPPNGGVNLVVAVLVGNGDGTFQAPIVTTFPFNGGADPVFRSPFAVGDLTGKGNMDLGLVDRENGGTYIFLGDGTGNFTAGTTVTSGRDSAYFIDLNGDQKLDLVTTDSFGGLFDVYLGNGDGTFLLPTQYSPGGPAGDFFLVDLNGDGHPDMLLEYSPQGTPILGYYPGNPNGTFGALVSLGAPPNTSQIVSYTDLNGDGIPDLAFLTPSGVGISLGGANQTFGALLTTISGGSTSVYSILPTMLGIADFNGDGKTDLAVPVEGGISILLGNGDGTFQSVNFYDLGHEVGGAAVADFNGDGKTDIAVTVAATYPRVLLGDGTGKFTLAPDQNTSYGSPGPYPTLLAADFNGDGKPDLNMGNMYPNGEFAGSNEYIAFNQGGGIFAAPVSIANSTPVLGDFNGDGRMDMIQVTGQQIIVLLGQANNFFSPVTSTLNLPFDTGLFNVGDVNGDGKLDLVLNYFDHLEIWLGNGNGTFTYSSSITLENNPNNAVAAVGDVDGDGKADIVLAPVYNGDAPATLTIFYGNGDVTFQAPISLPINREYSQVTIADVNRDGLPDLVMTDGSAVAVKINMGNRTFNSESDYIAGRSLSALSVVDVNGDGFPDIVVANTGGTTVTVLFNEPNGTSAAGAPVKGVLTITPNPSMSGQPFIISLSVAPQTAGGPTPSGTVSFSFNGSFLADVTLTNGAASYIYTAALLPGQYPVTAAYNGDSTYASKSFAVTQTILPQTYVTQIALSAAPTTLMAGQTARFSATVTSSVPVPTGVVSFLDGSATLGSASLDSSGVAQFDTALLAPGVHPISAEFLGYTDPGGFGTIFSPSASTAVTVTVNSYSTMITLTATPNPATAGSVIGLTAQVQSNGGVPFGGVSFFDGGVLLGTLGLNADASVTFNTASLATGSHTLSAVFNANGPFASSTSSPATVTITVAPESTTATLVALSPQVSTSGQVSLVAVVFPSNMPSGSPALVFLDRGVILGSAPISSGGIASLELAPAQGGNHSFTASFGGLDGWAPSVSPELQEAWPTTGPAFSLTVVSQQSRPAARTAAFFEVRVVTAADSPQPIVLACSAGLPSGYSCEFSPTILTGPGDSSLSIVDGTMNANSYSSSRSWPVASLVFVPVLFLATWRGRRLRLVALLVTITVLCSALGCGVLEKSQTSSKRVVLTIQASCGNGADATLSSAQITVQLKIGK
jgi:Big-like domain-containing protein/VCBS repeat protein